MPRRSQKKSVVRPFYLIGHNPNTIQLARAFIDAGANALEPDLRFVDGCIRVHDQFTVLGVRCRWPMFDGPGPTLSEYLRGLDENNISPALIAWDLKPPFQLRWMREALDTIRSDFGAKHPSTSMLFTVGSEEALGALKEFAQFLNEREAVGVDDFTPPALADSQLATVGKPYTYADRRRTKEISEAIAMRESSKSFALVYAWTVDDAEDLQKFLDMSIDGVIVDLEAVPDLRRTLQDPKNNLRFRLADASDRPF